MCESFASSEFDIDDITDSVLLDEYVNQSNSNNSLYMHSDASLAGSSYTHSDGRVYSEGNSQGSGLNINSNLVYSTNNMEQ